MYFAGTGPLLSRTLHPKYSCMVFVNPKYDPKYDPQVRLRGLSLQNNGTSILSEHSPAVQWHSSHPRYAYTLRARVRCLVALFTPQVRLLYFAGTGPLFGGTPHTPGTPIILSEHSPAVQWHSSHPRYAYHTLRARVRCLVALSTTLRSTGKPLRARTLSMSARARFPAPTPCPSSPHSSLSSSVVGVKNGSTWAGHK